LGYLIKKFLWCGQQARNR